jgi:hypothetical protein
MAMTYSELVAAINSYSENSFDTTDIDTFIQQAEQRIFNTVQLPDLRRNQVGNTTTGNKYLTTPSDWLSTYSLAVIDGNNEYTYLINKDVNFIRESFPDTDSAFYGKPEYYGIFDDNTFILGPTPDQQYTVELHYFYYPTSIVTAGTSWLGENFDTALFYGSLLEAATYLKAEPDVIANYTQRYTEALSMLKQLGDGKDRRDAYRSGQARYEVQ